MSTMCSCAVRPSSSNSAIVGAPKCVPYSNCSASVRKVSAYKAIVHKTVVHKTLAAVARFCPVFIGFIFSAHTFFSNKKIKYKGNVQALCLSGGKAKGNYQVGLLLFGLALLFSVSSTYAQSDKVYNINIPAQSVSASLTELSEQTEQMLLFSYEVTDTLSANPVVGYYTVMQALEIMLAGTGYTGGLTQQGVLMISIKKSKASDDKTKGKMSMNIKKNILAMTIGSVLAGGVGAQEGAPGQENGDWLLEEVVVTATKRETSLQDTAMSISALSGDTIEKRNLVSMDDYLRTLPGVSMQDRGAGQNSIVIRGMATNPQIEDSTTAVYFGGVPVTGLGASGNTGLAGSGDIKLADIERIEVLRGPQGTLYGSGSIGGTVRVLPASPDLGKTEGKILTRYSHTGKAGEDNTMVQAVLNLPLVEDTFAVRGVIYQFDNSGYVKNVAASRPSARISEAVELHGATARDQNDRGEERYKGYRLSALWDAGDLFDVKLSHLQQDISQDGQPEVNLDLGLFEQVRLSTGEAGTVGGEFMSADLELTSLEVDFDLGWSRLVSTSSWVDYDSNVVTDLPYSFFPDSEPYSNDNSAVTESFFEEIRLVSQSESSLQFVAGLYYEDIETDINTLWTWSGDPSLNPLPIDQRPSWMGVNTEKVEQKAVFGELSYTLLDDFELTVGGRHFDYDREDIAEFNGGDPTSADINETGQNYKANLSYTNDDDLFYMQWSEGFRLGSGSAQAPVCTAAGVVVQDVDSDRSENFELGVKSALVDGRINLNVAVYRINWDDIPVSINTDGCVHTVNAGKAKSEGVEVEIQAGLTENLRLDISASYVDAVLANDSSIGQKGMDLPGSADINFSLGAQYDFLLFGDVESFARLDYAYIGEYFSTIAKTDVSAGDFGQVDMKVGVELNNISADLFVDNLTDEDGLTWTESVLTTFSPSRRGYRIRPRTVGINLQYQF